MSTRAICNVDCIRDGKSFTTRRVVAIQKGRAIFNTAVSFQVSEDGFDHQDEMPPVAGPEGFAPELELAMQVASLDHAMWFHRDFRMDDWLLYAMESPNAAGAGD